jgi:hypothetical protein
MNQVRLLEAVVAALTLVAVAGCTSQAAPGEATFRSDPAVPAPTETADAAVVDTPSILGFDVCRWMAGEAGGPTVSFGVEPLYPSDEHQVVVLGPGDRHAVTCDIGGDVEGAWEVVASATLMSGGVGLMSGFSDGLDPFSYGGTQGLQVISAGARGVANVMVELEPGITLSVSGIAATSSVDEEMVGTYGVQPLIARMIDSWLVDKVPLVAESSFADAGAICDQVGFEGLAAVLEPTDETDVLVEYYRGSPVFTGDLFDGSIECGVVSIDADDSDDVVDRWPWNVRDFFGRSQIAITLDHYSDASQASAVVESQTSGESSCSGATAIGAPAMICEDGSGAAVRKAALGAWVVAADAQLVDYASSTDELDAVALSLLDVAQTASIVEPDGEDPRYPVVVDTRPPSGAACPAGLVTVSIAAGEGTSVATCQGDDSGLFLNVVEIDGISSEPFPYSCGIIDWSSHGGQTTSEVCFEPFSVFVADTAANAEGVTHPLPYVRKYLETQWNDDRYLGG